MKIQFVPLKDITAYELAMIYLSVPPAINVALKDTDIEIDPADWKALAPTVQRHFATSWVGA